jgi:hypothetical protein
LTANNRRVLQVIKSFQEGGVIDAIELMEWLEENVEEKRKKIKKNCQTKWSFDFSSYRWGSRLLRREVYFKVNDKKEF